MLLSPKSSSRARAALAPALALALTGCLGLGGSGPDTTATTEASGAEELDVRRFLGPDYCPEIRIRPGTEVARRYERGHEDDPAFVVWQASIGETARECLYDGQGNLTLRVGVSGRVAAGPKGGSETVSLPLRIAVVKYKEAVLASELYPLSIAIPPSNSTVFRQVHEINVPSPGSDRDYILYIGFDEKGENLLDPVAPAPPVVAAIEEPVEVIEEPVEVIEEPAPAAPPPPQQPAGPKVLPTPSDGFILPGG